DYWGDLLVENVNEALTATKSNFLLNLASNEYFRSLPPSKLEMPVISPAFKEMKNGKYKMISFFAKKARGTMASWVIKNKVRTLKKLQQFGDDGYRYDADTSTERVPVFLRG
ncbi:MAG: peroxide stress protein YaaA, partial [Planctomycetota bacterium]